MSWCQCWASTCEQSTIDTRIAQILTPGRAWSLADEATLANEVEHLAAALGRLAKASLVRIPPLPLSRCSCYYLSSPCACTSHI